MFHTRLIRLIDQLPHLFIGIDGDQRFAQNALPSVLLTLITKRDIKITYLLSYLWITAMSLNQRPQTTCLCQHPALSCATSLNQRSQTTCLCQHPALSCAMSLNQRLQTTCLCQHPALSYAATSIFLQLYLKPAVHVSFSRSFWLCPPFSSDRQHLSYDDCLEVRREIIRTVLCCSLYCVLKLCTVISTLRWAILYSSLDWVLSHWAHFTVPRFICVYVCVFVFTLSYCMCCIIVTRWGRPLYLVGLKLNP